jgi:hypothetical protein
MAIVQISKIQQRSGNLVDLPQLDEAEFGWASDAKRLFIGKTATGGSIENVEVLTSYSNISFSQLEGAVGNLDISAITVDDGQVLTYDGTNWVNRGGDAGGLINLGTVADVKIEGGAIGYVLSTDGTGNLTWTPKGTLYTNIVSLSNATPIVMTVANTTPYTNGQEITISGVNGNANANVNGLTFFVEVSNNYANTGNVSLYTTSDLGNAAVGTSLTYTNSPNAIATAVVSAGSGSAAAGGVDTNIQYNANGIIAGDAGFSFNASTKAMTLTGNATVGNLNTAGKVVASTLTSNIATGTAPLTITSTTRVANLNVATSGIANTVNDAAQPNITSTGTLTSLSVSGNANIGNIGTAGLIIATGNITGGNVAGGNLVTANFFTGTLTTNAQPNITSTGTLTSLSVSGNANVGNLGTAGLITATGNVTAGNLVTGGAVSATGNANVGNLGTTGVFSTTLSASGNANVGNLGTAGLITATGNVTSGNLVTGGAISATGNANVGNLGTTGVFATTLSASGNANVGNLGTGGLITVTGNIGGGNIITGGIVSATGNGTFGNVSATTFTGALSGAATTAGTVTTNAQPNITSTGTLTSLSVSGNANVGNLGTGGLITVTGNIDGGNIITGGIVSATGNGTFGNVAGGNLVTANFFTGTLTTAAQPNITSVSTSFTNLTFANAQTISGNNMTLTTGANTNLGTITGNFSLSAGSRLNATYADLAEYYEADKKYEPGTVLSFGGNKEVTIAEFGTNKVAGVVSTNPAYVMNMKCPGEYIVALALQGRVPTKVRGTIHKGDMLVSGGDGYARPSTSPQMGTVIGKALENFDGIEGVIEVAVGRL